MAEPKVLLPMLGGMYLLGSPKTKTTARLTTDAVINAIVLSQTGKALTGRARPSVAGEAGEFTGPSVDDKFASFPSGHTATAFAAARVLAVRHPKQRWLYYGLASLVGLARVHVSAHFPSDVVVGAGVGIYAADQAMREKHNYLTIHF